MLGEFRVRSPSIEIPNIYNTWRYDVFAFAMSKDTQVPQLIPIFDKLPKLEVVVNALGRQQTAHDEIYTAATAT